MSRILIVEDDETFAALAAGILRDHGYVVEVLGDGAAAVERLRAVRYDLVIFDVILPQFNGLQLVEAVKGGPGLPPRIIVISGISQGSDYGDRLLRASIGVDDYLSKPVRVAELLERVRAVLEAPVRRDWAGTPLSDADTSA